MVAPPDPVRSPGAAADPAAPRGGDPVRRARVLCAALAALDLGLGGVAALRPELYLGLLHPGAAADPVYLVQRTGALWLVFAAAELWAAGTGSASAFGAVALLRLMDVPADAVYLCTAWDGLGVLGVLGIGSAPPVNLAAGLWLLLVRRRLQRA